MVDLELRSGFWWVKKSFLSNRYARVLRILFTCHVRIIVKLYKWWKLLTNVVIIYLTCYKPTICFLIVQSLILPKCNDPLSVMAVCFILFSLSSFLSTFSSTFFFYQTPLIILSTFVTKNKYISTLLHSLS